MLIPKTPDWAKISGNFTFTVPTGTFSYPNRSEPSLEVQQSGILAGTPLTLYDINYQFNKVNENINFFKNTLSPNILNLTTSTRTIGEEDLFIPLRVVNGSACTYTIPALGVLSNLSGNGGLWFEIVQGGAGAITLAPGAGVNIETKTGFLAKTSGKGSRIFARRYKIETGTEYWEVYGEVGT